MRIPFAIQSYQSRSLPVSAQRCLNFYAEAAPKDAASPIFLIGTPGLTLFSGLGAGPIRGMCSYGGVLHVVSGADLYRVASNGSATRLAAIASSGDVFMAENGTQLGILVGASMFFWDGTTLNSVTDPDFPGAGSFTVLDGYGIFTETSGDTWFISDINDLSAYDALDIASAESAPDALVRAFIDHSTLFLCGEQTIEVWDDTGAAAFPFERVPNGIIEKGLFSPYAITKADNAPWWLSQEKIVYRANGYQPVRVSTHAIEGEMEGWESTDDIWMLAYSQDGHTFVAITNATQGHTFVNDAATGLWHERESGSLGYWRVRHYLNIYGKHIAGDHATGSLYEIDLDAFDEDGTTIRRIATAAPIDGGGKRTFMPSLEIVVETGVGLTSGQGSDPQLMLDYSDDGGRTWSNERWASMGAKGEYKRRVRFNRMGSFLKSRVYRLTVSDPVKSIVIGANG